MSINRHPRLARLAGAAALLLCTTAARAADLPFMPPPVPGAEAYGGGGFRAARGPVRPAPLRYDIYGYPLLAGAPNPLAAGGGCPAALQPIYDAIGNFAGYAPIPMCR